MNSDQLLLNGDRLVAPSKLGSMVSKYDSPLHGDVAVPYGEGNSKQHMKQSGLVSVIIDDYFELPDEEQVLGRKTECRFCQEEDFIMKMEAPCACKGTLQYAHRKCVQKWCSAKRSITCEICSQRYKPGYRAPPPPLDLSDSIAPGPRILVFTQATLQQQAILEPEPVEQPQTDEVLSQAKRCCSTFILLQTVFFCYNLMMMTVLVIVKDVLAGSHPYEKLDTSRILHLAGAFLLPSYVMAFLLYFCPWGRLKPEETTPGNAERPEVAIEVDSGKQDETADHQQRQDETVEPEIVSETEVQPVVSSIVTRERSQGNHLCQSQGQNPAEATSEYTETPAEVVIVVEFENPNAAADHPQLNDDEIEARPLLSRLRNSLARLRPQGNN